MKQPVLLAVIGYIIGILWGLYFNFSIVLLYIPIIVIYISYIKIFKLQNFRKMKFKLISLKRYSRYIKLFFNSTTIFCIIIFSIISNFIVIFQNKKYDTLYQNMDTIKIEGIVQSNKEEKLYCNRYKIKILKANNSLKYRGTFVYLQIPKNEKEILQYGDKIKVDGKFLLPEERRNFKGFNYKEYLKTLKIYGIVKSEKIEKISSNNCNILFFISNNIFLKIEKNINNIANQKDASILKGILLGDTVDIEDEIKEDFRKANISHILAISGMHVSYVILGIQIAFKNIIGKRKTKIITIIILIIYMFITGFSPSIVRASIMGILGIFSGIIHRKNNIWNAISISAFVLLIYNPFLINNLGVQLSYLGTTGIILFHSNILKILEKFIKKHLKKKSIVLEKINEILAVTISAQIIILPIMIYNFNKIGLYFLMTNILLSLIIGPLIILAFIFVLVSFINVQLAKFLYIILHLGINVIIIISKLGELPFSEIYIPTINIIIIYFIVILISNFLYQIYNSKKVNNTQIRIKNLISLFKYKYRLRQKKYIKMFACFLIIILIVKFCPQDLLIYFVDVGQGDCTFIITPNRKSILIDGGGSISDQFDVGKDILVPYILDRGYTKIDYIFISHFDSDHCRTD